MSRREDLEGVPETTRHHKALRKGRDARENLKRRLKIGLALQTPKLEKVSNVREA